MCCAIIVVRGVIKPLKVMLQCRLLDLTSSSARSQASRRKVLHEVCTSNLSDTGLYAAAAVSRKAASLAGSAFRKMMQMMMQGLTFWRASPFEGRFRFLRRLEIAHPPHSQLTMSPLSPHLLLFSMQTT